MQIMKLSDAQKEVIENLKQGHFIHVMTGIYPRAFYHSLGGKNVSTATVRALEKSGQVERRNEKFSGYELHLKSPHSGYET
jgi:hypothetical protein